ncbi:DPP IV N-terminal domain-containing protein [Candidatus Poribacteria bacterium]|nr:DPP IV N-terminal domain-containing protein [Candidatus Poribacteria bacterium]
MRSKILLNAIGLLLLHVAVLVGAFGQSSSFAESNQHNQKGEKRFSSSGKIVWTARNYKKVGRSGFNLWVMNLDGTEKRQLTSDEREEADFSPEWSPDGKWIAFLRGAELWKISVDGTQQQQLAPGVVHKFGWSPDNKHFCFIRQETLWLTDSSGRQPQQLTDHVGDFLWSPDGENLLFIKTVSQDTREMIAYNLLSNRESNRGYFLQPFDARWFPDSSGLLVWEGKTLWRVDLPDGTRHKLWETENEMTNPELSPDGQRVAFWIQETKADDLFNGQLVIMDLQGKQIQKIEMQEMKTPVGGRYSWVEGEGMQWVEGTPIEVFGGLEARVEAWLPDDSLLLNSYGGSTTGVILYTFDLNTDVLKTTSINLYGAWGFRGVAWSPDYRVAVCATNDAFVTIFAGIRVHHNQLILVDREGAKIKDLTDQVSLNYEPRLWVPRTK